MATTSVRLEEIESISMNSSSEPLLMITSSKPFPMITSSELFLRIFSSALRTAEIDYRGRKSKRNMKAGLKSHLKIKMR